MSVEQSRVIGVDETDVADLLLQEAYRTPLLESINRVEHTVKDEPFRWTRIQLDHISRVKQLASQDTKKRRASEPLFGSWAWYLKEILESDITKLNVKTQSINGESGPDMLPASISLFFSSILGKQVSKYSHVSFSSDNGSFTWGDISFGSSTALRAQYNIERGNLESLFLSHIQLNLTAQELAAQRSLQWQLRPEGNGDSNKKHYNTEIEDALICNVPLTDYYHYSAGVVYRHSGSSNQGVQLKSSMFDTNYQEKPLLGRLSDKEAAVLFTPDYAMEQHLRPLTTANYLRKMGI